MSENAKTITFVVIGLVAIVIGVATAPSSAELDKDSLVGKNLTEKFNTPVNTVKTWLRRSMLEIRDCLGLT